MISLKSRTIVQNAYVVRDLEAAMGRWINVFGAGPFLYLPERRAPIQYRGQESMLEQRLALGQAGPLHVELIQPLGNGPSIYSDMFGHDREGFHHICILSDEMEADIERYRRQGCEVAMSGAFSSMSFCMIDARPVIGVMLEIVTDAPAIRGMHDRVRDVAATWDGITDPIRPFSMPQTGAPS